MRCGMSRGVAAYDADRAGAIARSIKDAYPRSAAFGRIAEAVVASGPDRAEAISRSIEEAFNRACTMAALVRAG